MILLINIFLNRKEFFRFSDFQIFRFLFLIKLFFVTQYIFGQGQPPRITDIPYKGGEYLVFNMRYGPIIGGEVALLLTEEVWENNPCFHFKGVAKTVGIADKLFAVNDKYHSYYNKENGLPFFAIRDVKEGKSYTQYVETRFLRSEAAISSSINGIKKVPDNIHDMLSVFYYLRSIDYSKLKTNEIINFNTWFEEKLFPFYIIYRGKEEITTKFGKINCIKVAPVVEPGRVFKSKDDLYLWFTDDQNHLPILISMEMLVGHIWVELREYYNLKYPLKFKK